MKYFFIASIIVFVIAFYLYRSRYEIPGFTIYDTKQEAEFERIKQKIRKAKLAADLIICIKQIAQFQRDYNDFESLAQRDQLINLCQAQETKLIPDEVLETI